MVAATLTAFTVALGLLFLLWLGPGALVPYLVGLPLGLVLLWGSTSALRFDEVEVPSDVMPVPTEVPAHA